MRPTPVQRTLFEPLAQRHSATSTAAAESMRPHLTELQNRVYAVFCGADSGLTAQQIEDLTGLSGNTVRPRLLELEEAGLVRQTQEKRKTRSGRNAFVWRPA